MSVLRRPSSPIELMSVDSSTNSHGPRRHSSLPLSPQQLVVVESPKSTHSAVLPRLSPLRDKNPGSATSPRHRNPSRDLSDSEPGGDVEAMALRNGRRVSKLKLIKNRARSFRDDSKTPGGVVASDDEASPRRRRRSRQVPASREYVAVYSENPAPNRARVRAQALRKARGVVGSLRDVQATPKIAPAPTPIVGEFPFPFVLLGAWHRGRRGELLREMRGALSHRCPVDLLHDRLCPGRFPLRCGRCWGWWGSRQTCATTHEAAR